MEENARSQREVRGVRGVRGRPELGLSRKNMRQIYQVSDGKDGGEFTGGETSTAKVVNVIGPGEGLPIKPYSPRHPKLSGRKRPKGRPKKAPASDQRHEATFTGYGVPQVGFVFQQSMDIEDGGFSYRFFIKICCVKCLFFCIPLYHVHLDLHSIFIEKSFIPIL